MTETTETMTSRPGRWVMPRSRGGLSGLGLVLLGAWGAVIPFVGPYFSYAYTPNTTWTWTAARFYLQVLPGAVVFLAGLAILSSVHRASASAAGWLAAAAGAWFVIGPLVAPLWRSDYLGTPVGSTRDVSVEQIGMFYGLGAAIMLLAGMALGRFSLTGVRDQAYPDRSAAAQTMAPMTADAETAADDSGLSLEPPTRRPRHGWVHRGSRPLPH